MNKTPTKKETVGPEIINLEGKEVPETIPFVSNSEDHYLIYFPAVTMKDIYERSGNKQNNGDPLLYSISWYEKEKFFTEEKCREGWKLVPKKMIGHDMNWNEQEKLIPEGCYRPNAAEALYIMYAVEKATGKRVWSNEYCWTSSLASGSDLVDSGNLGDYGAFVASPHPGVLPRHLGRLSSLQCIRGR